MINQLRFGAALSVPSLLFILFNTSAQQAGQHSLTAVINLISVMSQQANRDVTLHQILISNTSQLEEEAREQLMLHRDRNHS